jgi:hypothetical protein
MDNQPFIMNPTFYFIVKYMAKLESLMHNPHSQSLRQNLFRSRNGRTTVDATVKVKVKAKVNVKVNV